MKEPCCFHLHGERLHNFTTKKQALLSFEMPVTIYLLTCYNISEDLCLQQYCCENLKSHKISIVRREYCTALSKIFVKYVCLRPFTFQPYVLYHTALAVCVYIIVMMFNFHGPNHYPNKICIMAHFHSYCNFYVSEQPLCIGLED